MFEFESKVVCIGARYPNAFSVLMVRDGLSAGFILGDGYQGYLVVSWNENTVTWYLGKTEREYSDMQLNQSGVIYYYVAIS